MAANRNCRCIYVGEKMSRIVIEANNPTGGQRAGILGIGGGENIDSNRL